MRLTLHDQPDTLAREYNEKYILAVAHKPAVCRHSNTLVPEF